MSEVDVRGHQWRDRVSLNTVLGLAQTAVLSVVGLLWVRFALRALGEADFGVLVSVGASGLYAALIVGGFSAAALRHLALDVGEAPDQADAGQAEPDASPGLQVTYSSVWGLFVAIGVAIAVVGWALNGVVLGFLDIPDGRDGAAKVAYLAFIGQLVTIAVSTPHRALLQAHQRLNGLIIADTVQRIAVLALVAAALVVSVDSLVWISVATLAASLVLALTVIGLARLTLPDVRFKVADASASRMRDLWHFARWSLLATASREGGAQIALLIINPVFGTVTAGAFGVANSANAMLVRFAAAYRQAALPEMTSRWGAGDRAGFRDAISAGSRWSVMVLVPLWVTAFIAIEDALWLWLDMSETEDPAAYVAEVSVFIRLVLTASVVRRMANGIGFAVSAADRIRSSTIATAVVDAVTLTLGAIAVLAFDQPAWVLPALLIVGNAVFSLVLVVKFGPEFDVNLRSWGREVLMPLVVGIVLVAGAAALAGLVPGPRLVRVCAVAAAALLASVAVARWVVSTHAEREAGDAWLDARRGSLS